VKRKLKILIAPDSFKGSITAVKLTQILESVLLSNFPELIIESVPLADGGEGSLAAIESTRTFLKVRTKVLNAQHIEIACTYLIDTKEKTAFIELAGASGLMQVKGKNNIMQATTYGTGQLIRHAIENGAKKIVLFLGGSATCDAGIGIAKALGVSFYTEGFFEFDPQPVTIQQIMSIGTSCSLPIIRETKMILAVDVNNPFSGPTGASYVYAPQKGADEEQVRLLDSSLRHLAQVIGIKTGIDLNDTIGAGAAGGVAGTLHALFGAKIVSGSEFIFNQNQIEEKVKQADLIISGEGKIDSQSLNNKLLFALSRLTFKYKKKLWAVCGYFDGDERIRDNLFIEKVYCLARTHQQIGQAIKNVEVKLEEEAKKIALDITVLQNF
jgi:glycerate 2-kinase